MPVFAQLNASHYINMYNNILDSLHIKEAYVSDSLRELKNLGYVLYEKRLRDSIPLYNPFVKQKVEYSNLLHCNFNVVEDIAWPIPIPPCLNVIYFSFLDESYICANVYVCVRRIWSMDDFPMWGYYGDLYSFTFRIEDNIVTLLDVTPIYEM